MLPTYHTVHCFLLVNAKNTCGVLRIVNEEDAKHCPLPFSCPLMRRYLIKVSTRLCVRWEDTPFDSNTILNWNYQCKCQYLYLTVVKAAGILRILTECWNLSRVAEFTDQQPILFGKLQNGEEEAPWVRWPWVGWSILARRMSMRTLFVPAGVLARCWRAADAIAANELACLWASAVFPTRGTKVQYSLLN